MKYVFIAAFTMLMLAIFSPKDDSDPPNGGYFDRSGLTLHRDALTGCEYLGRGFSGLTPRIDAQGKPVCRKDKP